MPSRKPDHYAILGVLRDATEEEIKRAYFQSAQRLHPDKNSVEGETELFLETQQAYEVLSNPTRRRQYDATLPPEIKAEKEVAHKTYLSRPNLVRIGENQLVYILIEVAPQEKKNQDLPTPPLNICLV
jgi:DnaJ-class molecular chaperone